jgi:hypothetical protein
MITNSTITGESFSERLSGYEEMCLPTYEPEDPHDEVSFYVRK